MAEVVKVLQQWESEKSAIELTRCAKQHDAYVETVLSVRKRSPDQAHCGVCGSHWFAPFPFGIEATKSMLE
jgi:hypothetical protein